MPSPIRRAVARERGIAVESELLAEIRMAARLGARQDAAVPARLAGGLNRIENPAVAGAAAEVAVERLRDRVAVAGLARAASATPRAR